MNTRFPRTLLMRALAASGFALLAACSSTPIQNNALDQARSRLNEIGRAHV